MSSPLQRFLSPKLTGLCGIFGHLLGFIFIFLAILASPWFTWTGYALSNLGDLTRTSAPLFNGGLLLGGVISVFFVAGFGARAKARLLGTIGTVSLTASALGVIGVSIFPMNFLLPHAISAVTIFLCNSIALFVFGVLFTLHSSTRLLGMVSFVLCFVSIFVWFLPWGAGIAIPEFIAVLAMYVWIVVMSVKLIMGNDVITK